MSTEALSWETPELSTGAANVQSGCRGLSPQATCHPQRVRKRLDIQTPACQRQRHQIACTQAVKLSMHAPWRGRLTQMPVDPAADGARALARLRAAGRWRSPAARSIRPRPDRRLDGPEAACCAVLGWPGPVGVEVLPFLTQQGLERPPETDSHPSVININII